MDDANSRMSTERSRTSTQAVEGSRVRHYDNKPLNEIEEDIARTRVRLSATIEALERELAPERIVEKSTQVLHSALEPPPGPFREQVWAYAIPLALIASGLGWLFLLRRHTYHANAPLIPSELPAEAIELGETSFPAAFDADVVGPIEPVSLVEEKTEL